MNLEGQLFLIIITQQKEKEVEFMISLASAMGFC